MANAAPKNTPKTPEKPTEKKKVSPVDNNKYPSSTKRAYGTVVYK